MMSSLAARAQAYPRLRQFAIDFVLALPIDVAIAVVITYGMRVGSFTPNLVISLCIGIIGVTLIDGARLWLWGLGRPKHLPFFVLLIAGIVFSQKAGTYVASQILGFPYERLSMGVSRDLSGYLVMTFLIGFSVTWFFWNRGKVAYLKAEAEAEKARAAAIEKQALQAQLQMLQAQIEPHMMFNTLANLQGLIAMDPPRAQHMLDLLIQYLRATLSASRADKTTLAQEFKLVEAFLGLMKVRMGSRLDCTLDLPDELGQLAVPPMMLQPLVENAIKHGIEPHVDGGHITIRAARNANDGSMLELSVADTGLGLDAAPQDGTRTGNANLRERLQVLYGDRASFELIPHVPQGALARIRRPL